MNEAILLSFKAFWNNWELRILVMLSLFLQIVLILAANVRKKISLPLVRATLWLAYLLADLVATYSLGVLSRSQIRNTEVAKKDDWLYFDMQLMALWAPFLLLHLGGPDTITAFSLEDNQLWLRHGLGLLVQVCMAANILARYYPEGRLLIASALVFVAGTLKYGERTWALKRGSMDGLRISMLGEPDPGPDYANTMNQYAAKLRAGMPAPINVRREFEEGHDTDDDTTVPESDHNRRQRHHQKMIRVAYGFFKKFKGLFVDSIFTFKDRKESRSFFLKTTAEWAFRVVEIELSFAYDVLYTKASVSRTVAGLAIRTVNLVCTVAAALSFYHNIGLNRELLVNRTIQMKVYITYALFTGALAIDSFSLALLVFSDWTIILVDPSGDRIWRWIQGGILRLRPVDRCRWSNMISQYNLLGFCLKDRRCPSFIKKIVDKLGLKMMADCYWYTVHVSMTSDLQKFIFDELKKRSKEAQNLSNYKLFTDCKGEWALEKEKLLVSLGWTVKDAEFDESLLIWHIAIDLCYRSLPVATTTPTPDEERELKHRQMAQELSNYLLYLLVVRPLMLSSTAVVGVKKFMDTCAEATKFFIDEPKSLEMMDACRLLLTVNTDHRAIEVKGDRSKSVLWDGCRLAKSLELLEGNRWRVICRVLFEMLSYAATHCRGYYHAEQLSNGGELVTFVWFLVTHFGMGEQYMIEAGNNSANVVDDEIS